VPNRDARGGVAGATASRGMDRFPPPIYISYKLSARVNRIIRVIHDICKHSRYSKILLAGARGFYLSLWERVFHVKILCSPLCFLFYLRYLPIAFIKSGIRARGFLI
jgi:hypothetical protein